MNSKWIRIVTIYRPPPSTLNGFTVVQFLSKFAMFLELLILLPGQILILGDVNFHLEDTSTSQTMEFLELLDIFSLKQLVNQPTHRLGHTLDCIITEESVNLVDTRQVHATRELELFAVAAAILAVFNFGETGIEFTNTKNDGFTRMITAFFFRNIFD